MADRIPVYLVSSVYGATHTGIQTYLKYLWDHFGEDEAFEYHLVSSGFEPAHPRQYSAGQLSGPTTHRRVALFAKSLLRKEKRPCVVHSNIAWATGALVSNRYPLIGQINDYENADLFRRFGPLFKASPRRCFSLACRALLERRAIQREYLTLANSHYTRSRVAEAYRLDPSRIQVLYKAVDCARFERPASLPPDPLNRPEDRFRLVFVGSDWQRKGLPNVVESMPRLPADTHLSVVGVAPEVFRQRFGSFIEEHGLSDRVTVGGYIPFEQLPALYWHSDAFVFPSTAEALGIAILEAMAAGLPVIVGDAGGMPEIVDKPERGLVVPPQDLEALAAAIQRLHEDPALRQRLAKEGPRRASAFSTETMLTRLREIYMEVYAGFYGGGA